MDPLVLRSIERILDVIVGGMAIILGYRLFRSVPGASDGKGTFKFPMHTSVMLTKVGPGVFFALFGAAIICMALFRGLDLTVDGRHIRYAGSVHAASSARADARALMRREMATLNALPGMLDPKLDEQSRDDATRSLRRAKLQLMKPAWGDARDGFGDYKDFETWVEQGEQGPAPANSSEALALYRYGARP
jgi:hypothetical protein